MLIRTAFLIGERDDNTNRQMKPKAKDEQGAKMKHLPLEKFDEIKMKSNVPAISLLLSF